MKIALVSVEDGIMAVGFRKFAAFVRTLDAAAEPRYVAQGNYRSLRRILSARMGGDGAAAREFVDGAAEPLAKADLIGFSSMTGYAPLTIQLIGRIRELNPRAYVVWGGIHPIIVPDDAIRHADAICTGEGELAFWEFLDRFKDGRDFTRTRNFWFRRGDSVVRNGFRPLMTEEEMSRLPLPLYGADERVFEPEKGYVPLAPAHYVAHNGLGYNTVWSVGCPFSCTYCGNTKFIENDASYRKIRHPGVRYIVEELKQARRVHPHVSTNVLHDDSFMALPLETLSEFARAYKREVGIPFCVQGVIPNYVRADKLEVLLEAGLNRVRMGVQNGSERILAFYDRPTPPPRVAAAAAVLSRYAPYMIPPAYDVIIDNPVETRDDVVANLEFLDRLPRPFTFNIFSLRSIPNTELERQLRERNVSIDAISANYFANAPTLANCLLYLIAVIRPPRFLYKALLARAEPAATAQELYPRFFALCRAVYLAKRGLDHVRFMDFSILVGRPGYWLWRTGFIAFWRRRMVPRFERSPGRGREAATSSTCPA